MPKSRSCRFPEPSDPRFTPNALRCANKEHVMRGMVLVGDRRVDRRTFDDPPPDRGK